MRWALLALLLLAPACRAPQEPGPGDRLDAFLHELHRQERFSGAVVLTRNGKVLFEHGFGFADREAEVPFTPDTAADTGSVAKTFTAAAILKLAAEGRLALDAPAREILPELPYSEITLRHLVTHTAGLPDYPWFEPFLRPDEVRTTERFLRILAEQKPALPVAPGQAFEYSSLGFDLAALAVERVSGRPFEAFLREWVLAPLGMDSAFLRPARFADWGGVRPRAYRRAESGSWEPFDVADLEGFYGGSNLYLSARDLARWADAWGKPLLEEALLPARIGRGTSGLTLGSWYRSRDGARLWYPGHLQGFHALAWRDAGTGDAIGFVSNSTIDGAVQSGLVPAMRAAVEGQDPWPLLEASWEPLTDRDLERLEGCYRFPDRRTACLVRRNGDLWISTPDLVEYRMIRTEPAVFYVPGLEAWIGFTHGRGEKIDRLVWRTLEGEEVGAPIRCAIGALPVVFLGFFTLACSLGGVAVLLVARRNERARQREDAHRRALWSQL